MPNDVKTYDLIIIGAGSGNMIPVPEMDGWNLAIVEPDKFGGTCLNRGCIPSKMLLYPAEIVETTQHGAKLGVHHTLDRIDWQRIVGRVRQKIDPIAEAGAVYRKSQPHITVYDQPAHFVAERVLETGGQRITADRIVLGAGSRPAVPNLPGLDRVPYHTSDTIMRLEAQPTSLLIIGGGYIGEADKKNKRDFHAPRRRRSAPGVSGYAAFSSPEEAARGSRQRKLLARGSCWALLGARRWETGSHVSDTNAHPVADSIRAAEADGFNQVGLGHLPQYCDDARSGRVDGHASPTWDQTAEAAILVNAHHGFSHAPLPLPTNLWSS